MAETRPIMRPSDIRRAVAEWTAAGCAVTVHPDGTIRVVPPNATSPDPFDLVDMSR